MPNQFSTPPVFIECLQCGKTTRKKAYQLRDGTAKYCSRPCQYAYHRTDPVTRFWNHVVKQGDDECWDWSGSGNQFGHGMFNISHTERMYAHRYSWQLVHGVIPEGMWLLHLCDRPQCCNPKHLVLGDHRLNTLHAVDRDRVAKGEHNGGAKLSVDDIAAIRERYAKGGIAAKQLGRQFGIGESQTLRIIHRQSWKHVA